MTCGTGGSTYAVGQGSVQDSGFRLAVCGALSRPQPVPVRLSTDQLAADIPGVWHQHVSTSTHLHSIVLGPAKATSVS